MSEEKLRILKLLEGKKITSAEAMELLEALGESARGGGERRGRQLRIRVYEDGSPEPRVNISVPLSWVKFLTPFMEGRIKAKLADKGHDLDLGKIQEAIEKQEPMRMVDVQDGGDKIEIFIE